MRNTALAVVLACLLWGTAYAPGSALAAGLGAEIQKKAASYDPIVRRIANQYVVDPALIHSIIAAESAYNRFAVSGKGAQGLMQLMPETARDYGVENTFDAVQNIEGGVKYLKDLQKSYPGRTDLVLAAYNAGPKAVEKYEGIPPYAETKTYVARVKGYLREMSAARKRTPIYEIIDEQGRRIVTNDPRLAYK
jgi:soluble lytic murein transglycosylase-like protein